MGVVVADRPLVALVDIVIRLAEIGGWADLTVRIGQQGADFRQEAVGVAVNLVVNYEEGSEYSKPAGDGRNEGLAEIPYTMPPEYRDLCAESVYEYGSRAGIWRLMRLFDEYDVKVTFFACAVALVLFIFFFDALSTVLLGGLAAAIVACALNPLVRYIPGPRGLAAALLGLGLIAAVTCLILAFSFPLADHISNEFKEWPQTKVGIDEMLERWSAKAGLHEAVTVDALLANV